MPVIPATSKAKAGGLQVQSQPGLLSETLFQNIIKKEGKVQLSGRVLA
jgi:hypothetical protein